MRIKFLTIIFVIVLIATAVVDKGYWDTISEYLEARESTTESVLENSNTLTSLNNQISALQEEYSDVAIMSNEDIANAINGFDGCTLVSITSIAESNGELINCAEVTDIGDISFFNEQTKYMRFKCKVTNFNTFVGSLSESAVVVEEIEYDDSKKIARILVATLFDSTSEEQEDSTDA